MNAIPANVGSYRDRHGKQRWRYRKGQISVQLPGQPGQQRFNDRARQAAAGLVRQKERHAHPSRLLLLDDFSADALARAAHRARSKGVPFLLTPEDVAATMEAQRWRCAISGVAFFQRRRSDPAFRPTLDRITPATGYVAGNVRIVAYIVNLAMNEWGEKPLWALVEAMAKRPRVRRPVGNAR